MELGGSALSQLEAVELEVNIMMATGVIEVQALSFTTSQQLEAEVEALELIPAQNQEIHQTEMVDLGGGRGVCGSSAGSGTSGQGNSGSVHLEQTKSLKMVAEAERVALMRVTLLEVLDIIHSYQIHFFGGGGGGVTNNANANSGGHGASPTGAGATNKGSGGQGYAGYKGYGSAGGSGLVLVGYED